MIYFDDLPPDEHDYWTGQRSRIVKAVQQATGLPVELRAEGVALLDDRNLATDLALPDRGTEGHVTLLIAEHLADALRQGTPEITRNDLHQKTVQLIRQYGKHWKNAAREPGAELWLVDRAVSRLHGLNLVTPLADPGQPWRAVHPRPAIARYRIAAVRGGHPAEEDDA